MQKVRFYDDPHIRWFWWLGLFLNLCVWSLITLLLPFRVNSVNVHYTIYFGIDKIGAWYELLIVPGAMLFVHVLNFWFARFYYEKSAYFGHVVAGLTLVMHICVLGVGMLALSLNV